MGIGVEVRQKEGFRALKDACERLIASSVHYIVDQVVALGTWHLARDET